MSDQIPQAHRIALLEFSQWAQKHQKVLACGLMHGIQFGASEKVVEYLREDIPDQEAFGRVAGNLVPVGTGLAMSATPMPSQEGSVDLVDEISGVVSVIGGAGFGKTTLVKQLLSVDENIVYMDCSSEDITLDNIKRLLESSRVCILDDISKIKDVQGVADLIKDYCARNLLIAVCRHISDLEMIPGHLIVAEIAVPHWSKRIAISNQNSGIL